MSQYFKMIEPQEGGKFLGRCVGLTNSKEFIQFIDVLREQGMGVAMPIFPKKWEWVGEDYIKRPVFDLVPTFSSGLVLSDRAYRVVGSLFPAATTPHADFELDGAVYHWIGFSGVRGKLEEITTLPIDARTPVVKLMPSAVMICREVFVKAWTQAGLTGAVFTKV